MKDIHEDIHLWHTEEHGELPLHIFLGMPHDVFQRWVSKDLTAEELACYGYYEDLSGAGGWAGY